VCIRTAFVFFLFFLSLHFYYGTVKFIEQCWKKPAKTSTFMQTLCHRPCPTSFFSPSLSLSFPGGLQGLRPRGHPIFPEPMARWSRAVCWANTACAPWEVSVTEASRDNRVAADRTGYPLPCPASTAVARLSPSPARPFPATWRAAWARRLLTLS
jgi:hypothetical protein